MRCCFENDVKQTRKHRGNREPQKTKELRQVGQELDLLFAVTLFALIDEALKESVLAANSAIFDRPKESREVFLDRSSGRIRTRRTELT